MSSQCPLAGRNIWSEKSWLTEAVLGIKQVAHRLGVQRNNFRASEWGETLYHIAGISTDPLISVPKFGWWSEAMKAPPHPTTLYPASVRIDGRSREGPCELGLIV